MATDYNAVEIAFFKAIVRFLSTPAFLFTATIPYQVEQIMLAPREAFSVSSLAALRELSTSKINMPKYQAETVLSSFVSKGWLLKSA